MTLLFGIRQWSARLCKKGRIVYRGRYGEKADYEVSLEMDEQMELAFGLSPVYRNGEQKWIY
jgi:hypothetical protein